MFKIKENNSIHISRGETCILEVTAKDDDNNDYIFKIGDIIRFAVYKKDNYNELKIKKDVIVLEESTSIDIELLSEETKLDEIINKPRDYWYEITLNPDTNAHTIIGYDDISGAKIFRLYPEGVDE